MRKLSVDGFIEAHPELVKMIRLDAQRRVARWIQRGRITANADGTIDEEHLVKELAALPVVAPVMGEKELIAVIANLQAQLTQRDEEIAALKEEIAATKHPKKK